ncbi:MAG: radical SAM protein [Elusimicrobia bacterium]|nr:radical SAM protein [Elusimicrobiota bacterium]
MNLLVADEKNRILDILTFLPCGQSGDVLSCLKEADLIPLPKGSDLFFLPDRDPVGWNKTAREFQIVSGARPVAAFLPPGYTILHTTAYRERPSAGLLPLFSYAPVAWHRGRHYVPAIQVDRRKNHDLCGLDRKDLSRRIRAFSKTENRLIRHLMLCAEGHGCPNAINFFLGKYEAPLPTSPSCNARCLGCISSQPKGSCPPTQPRLTFVPTAEEIAEVALRHFEKVPRGVASFGQGCEGEPLLQARVIAKAIRLIRQKTSDGTIHMNTNASRPDDLTGLLEVGLNSIRVSMNSVRKEYYTRYYSPKGYSFEDVIRSIRAAKKSERFVALNYLVMPGFTDRAGEIRALRSFIKKYGIDMVQWRNMNFDPHRYFERLTGSSPEKPLGMRTLMGTLRREFPRLKHGYFNVPKQDF